MSASLHSPLGRAAGVAHNMCHTRNTVELCVLCRRVSQLYMSYPSMSGSVYGGEWDALSVTQRRRIAADKWIRSVTVTVASGGLFVRVCVCQGSSRHHYIQSSLSYSHTVLCLSHPGSANTTLIWILSVLLLFGVKSQRSSWLFATNAAHQHPTWRSSRHSVRSRALAEQPVLQPEKMRLTYGQTKAS